MAIMFGCINSFHLDLIQLPSYKNQSIDLQSKLIDWLLYDGNSGI